MLGMTTLPAIRPYRPEDRPALDDICVRTAHNGQDSRPHYTDPAIFPVTFAAPYVHLEPDLAFVLDDGQGWAVGYILGTADTARFAEAFRSTWLPLVADRYPKPPEPPRTPDEAMAALLHNPERMVLPDIDLLPAWQGGGHGRRLMRTFLATLQDRGVPAVHLAMATANTRARAFYDRMGFHELDVPEPDSATYLGRTTKELDRL
jgi:ribosomal protein S18 acetylase RimI-like enzyme